MKNVFFINVGELNIQIEAEYSYLPLQCRDYFYIEPDIKPDIIAKPNILESEISEVGAHVAESLAVYRSIAEQLPLFDSFVTHGASIKYSDGGYIFIAPSGTGKSTHVRLWHKAFCDKMTVINGDKPIIGIRNGEVYIYGTPWAGKENWQHNIYAKLKGICYLQRGAKNEAYAANPDDYIESILNQVYMPKNAVGTVRTMDILNRVLKKVPFYVLKCTPDIEAVEKIFPLMTGEEFKMEN